MAVIFDLMMLGFLKLFEIGSSMQKKDSIGKFILLDENRGNNTFEQRPKFDNDPYLNSEYNDGPDW